MMLWGMTPPLALPQPPDRRACSVMDSWPLGGGPGVFRTKTFLHEPDCAYVEFDDAPGFWWAVPLALIVWDGARQVAPQDSSS